MKKDRIWKVLFVGFSIIAGLIGNAWSQDRKDVSEYVGSKTCLSCHAEKEKPWKSSRHANMLVPVVNASSLPLDPAKAPEKLQSELKKASYMVAGTFFIAPDPETKHLKLLGVVYDKASNTYKPSNVNLDWSTSCSGCHTTNMNTRTLTWGEDGIGCEACHGPGQNHTSGDASKIVVSKAADICGQCHGGNDAQTGGKLMADGTKWVVGFKPGMKLSDVPGLQMTPVDPAKLPPDPALDANHLRNYNMWAASGHSKALTLISKSPQATADCYGCHSAEGFAAKLEGKKVDLSKKESFNSITCVACHDPHNSGHPRQLRMDPEELCNSCHTQNAVLKGKGAKGIEDTRSFHSAVPCVSCHMTESNHLMKVIRPDAPDLPEKRLDTCTNCHKDNNRKARAAQIKEWQSTYQERMDALQSEIKTISAVLKEKPDLLNAELKAKFGNVRTNLSILVRDKSRGAHNIDFAAEIFSLASRDLAEIKAAVK
jgi:predicted CXXCH cytochrome family protein